MKIAITGANGYIGARLVSRALTDGHSVVALVRRPLPRTDVISLAYDLSSKFVPPLPDNINIIIHLAANTVDNAGVAREELYAAQLLIEAAQNIRQHSSLSPAKLHVPMHRHSMVEPNGKSNRSFWPLVVLLSVRDRYTVEFSKAYLVS